MNISHETEHIISTQYNYSNNVPVDRFGKKTESNPKPVLPQEGMIVPDAVLFFDQI